MNPHAYSPEEIECETLRALMAGKDITATWHATRGEDEGFIHFYTLSGSDAPASKVISRYGGLVWEKDDPEEFAEICERWRTDRTPLQRAVGGEDPFGEDPNG